MIHALGSENQATRGSKTRQRRPTTSGLASMRVQAAMVLAIAVQSSAFLASPSARAALRAPRSQASTPVMMAYDVRYSPNRWRDDPEDIKPGFGGIWPGDPDAKTHQVTFVNKAGETVAKADVPVDRYIFFAAEDAGIDVPIVNKKRMCRNGCCTTCAVKVLEGKVKTEGALGLLKELKKEGYALTCCSLPKSDLVVQLQEEDDVYMKQFGEDFERGGVEWGGFFLDED